jgi:hypothetical protein
MELFDGCGCADGTHAIGRDGVRYPGGGKRFIASEGGRKKTGNKRISRAGRIDNSANAFGRKQLCLPVMVNITTP